MHVRPHHLLPRRVRTFPPEEVTSISPAEVDPRSVGLTRRDVDAIWAAVVRYYGIGLQPAMALCIRRRGQVILDRAIGHARGNGPGELGPLVPATPDTLFNFFSGSKSITAMLVLLLEQRGEIDLDAPVARYIPEFGRHGKDRITIRHVLTHRAGIPAVPPDLVDVDLIWNREHLVEVLSETRPISAAGHELAYHAVTGGFVLGEIIHRVTGRDARAFLDDEIRKPLGFDALSFGVPPARLGEVARESFTGPKARRPFSILLERSLGLPLERIVDLANDERFLTGIVPSGNVIATANEIGRYFELLLRQGELDGVKVFERETVRRGVARENLEIQLDRTIMLPIRYGMGFMLGGEHLSFYGRGTPLAFGHLGFTNVLGWADPERDISVAFMNNGKPFVTPELVLWLNIPRVIARKVPRDADTRDWRS